MADFTRPSMLYDLRDNPAVLCSATDYPVVGKPILEASRFLGVYGKSEDGATASFLGMRLPDEADEERWLVCTIWCADNWLMVDEHPIHSHVDVAAIYKPLVFMWLGSDERFDNFTPMFADHPVISEFVIEPREMRMVFGEHVMHFDESSERRPTFPSGTTRELTEDDDLRNAWVITKSRLLRVEADDD